MKMKLFIVYFFCSIIFIANINALATENKFHNHHHKSRSHKQNIRPNVHDIKRFLKPMIAAPEQPYIPEEVSSLRNKMESDGRLLFIFFILNS